MNLSEKPNHILVIGFLSQTPLHKIIKLCDKTLSSMQAKNRGAEVDGGAPSSWPRDGHIDLPLPEAVPGGFLAPQPGGKAHPNGPKEKPPRPLLGAAFKGSWMGCKGKCLGEITPRAGAECQCHSWGYRSSNLLLQKEKSSTNTRKIAGCFAGHLTIHLNRH